MKPKCTLVGIDGNAFAVIGAVKTALKKAGMAVEAVEWQRKAFECDSYDALLQLAMQTVEVE